MMRLYLILGLVVGLIAACGNVESLQDQFTVSGEALFIRRGESQAMVITLARAKGVDDVAITVDGLPAGVTADALVIPGMSSTGMLALHAAATATEGVAMLVVHGTVQHIVADGNVRLLVGGAPGSVDESFAMNGRFVTTLTGMGLVGRGIVASGDSIIATGANTTSPQTVTVKLRADGTPDPAFGTNGLV